MFFIVISLKCMFLFSFFFCIVRLCVGKYNVFVQKWCLIFPLNLVLSPSLNVVVTCTCKTICFCERIKKNRSYT